MGHAGHVEEDVEDRLAVVSSGVVGVGRHEADGALETPEGEAARVEATADGVAVAVVSLAGEDVAEVDNRVTGLYAVYVYSSA